MQTRAEPVHMYNIGSTAIYELNQLNLNHALENWLL